MKIFNFKQLLPAASGLLMLSYASAASAITIDFSTLPPGGQGSTTIVFPEATFSTPDGVDLFTGASGIASEICALTAGFSCEADLEVNFTGLVSDLSFETSGFNTGDQVLASIFDVSNNLLSSTNVTTNTLVDFAGFSGISRLFLDDSSTGAGFGYDNFTFNAAQEVSEPATFAVLGFGLLGLGLAWRRRKT